MILKNKEQILKILKSLVAGNDSLALSNLDQEHPVSVTIVDVTADYIYLQSSFALHGLTPSGQVGHATSELFARNSSLAGCHVV